MCENTFKKNDGKIYVWNKKPIVGQRKILDDNPFHKWTRTQSKGVFMNQKLEKIVENFLLNNDISDMDLIVAYNSISFGETIVSDEDCEYIFNYLSDMKVVSHELIENALKSL